MTEHEPPVVEWTDEDDYRHNVKSGFYGMPSKKGNEAVAAIVRDVREQIAGGALDSPDAVRVVLRARMFALLGTGLNEAWNSEAWMHLTYAFADVLDRPANR